MKETFIKLLSGPITLVVTPSPIVNSPISVLGLTYNSKIVLLLTTFLKTFSTVAVAPESTPVILLLAKISLFKVSAYPTLITAPFVGAVLNTSFCDSFLMP